MPDPYDEDDTDYDSGHDTTLAFFLLVLIGGGWLIWGRA